MSPFKTVHNFLDLKKYLSARLECSCLSSACIPAGLLPFCIPACNLPFCIPACRLPACIHGSCYFPFLPEFMPAAACLHFCWLLSACIFACCCPQAFLPVATVLHSFSPPPAA
jgi:hypothetical protein